MVRKRGFRGPLVLLGAIALWAVALGVGNIALVRHEFIAGADGVPPARWPTDEPNAGPRAAPLVVMFVHPRCPCTLASLGELNRICCDAATRPDVLILFVTPPGELDDWARDANWDAAALIPHARLVIDRDGAAADRFGARTSGQTLLYGADGMLLFSGGITPGRGHAGDSVGRSAILAALGGPTDRAASAPVFGCSLLGDARRCAAACPSERAP